MTEPDDDDICTADPNYREPEPTDPADPWDGCESQAVWECDQ